MREDNALYHSGGCTRIQEVRYPIVPEIPFDQQPVTFQTPCAQTDIWQQEGGPIRHTDLVLHRLRGADGAPLFR